MNAQDSPLAPLANVFAHKLNEGDHVINVGTVQAKPVEYGTYVIVTIGVTEQSLALGKPSTGFRDFTFHSHDIVTVLL